MLLIVITFLFSIIFEKIVYNKNKTPFPKMKIKKKYLSYHYVEIVGLNDAGWILTIK